MFNAGVEGRILRIVDQRLQSRRFAERGPVVRHRRDINKTVLRPEGAHGRDGRVMVALLRWDLLVNKPARGLEIEQEDHRFQQRRLHPLPFAGPFSLQKRQRDSVGTKDACCHVADCGAGSHGAVAGNAGDQHMSTHALSDLVKAGTFGVGAVLTETGNAAIDNAGINRFQRFIIHLQAVLYARPHVFDHDVRFLRHAVKDFPAFVGFEVQRHRLLVSVQVLEIRPVPLAKVCVRIRAGCFDLHYVSTPVCELADGGGARSRTGQV